MNDTFYLKEIDFNENLEEKEEYENLREEIRDNLKERMTRPFQEIVNAIEKWNSCLIISPRNTGKSYNTSLLVLWIMLYFDKDATALRKFKTRNKNSISKNFKEAIKGDYSSFFIQTKEKITFSFGGNKRVLTFDGMSDAESFKGTHDQILWIDEAQQLSQEDFKTALPSVRSIDNTHKKIITCNIPRDGKKSWIYKQFIENNQDPHFKYVKLSFEDNPYAFRNSEKIEEWIEEQRGYFYGRENDFKREILGEWLEQNEFNVFKNWEVIDNPNLKANIWIIIYESSQPFSLGILLQENSFIVVKEIFDLPTEEDVRKTSFILTKEESFKFFENKIYLASLAIFYSSVSLKEISAIFSQIKIFIEKSNKLSLSEIELASFSVEEESLFLLDRPLTKNIKGLFVRSLSLLANLYK